MSAADIQTLADEIGKLTPPAKLRLAADLLEARKPDIAYTLIDRVRLDLGAALMLARKP